MDPTNNNAPADNTPDQDDQEWEQALESYSKDRGVAPDADKGEGGDGKQQTPEEKKAAEDKVVADKKVADEAAAKKTADDAEAEKAKTETPEQTTARHEKEAADKKAADAQKARQETPDDPTTRTYRRTQAEVAKQESEMREDIAKELFPNRRTQILDSDGDVVATVQDVMKLRNSATGKAFTEDEATSWLLKAQQSLNAEIAKDDAQIEKIAAVNLDLHDQADSVKAKYGALLRTMPDVAKEIVAEFNASLKTDPKTGYILEAPLNMERFFDIAMKPYALQAQQLEALNNTEQARIDKEAKEKKDGDRKRVRQDRSDIYGGGKVETMDEDEKEWADAAATYYKNKGV